MRHMSNMARPYAKAIFELAADKEQLQDWKTFLQQVKSIVTQPEIDKLLSQPDLDMTRVYTIFSEALGLEPDGEFANLLKMLTQKGRVWLLPSIVDEFIHYKEEYQNTLNVHVKAAIELTAEQEQKLKQILAHYFGKYIYMTTSVDPDILGGAIIYAKDLVIDGSGRGRLNQLHQTLKGKLLCN